MSEEGRVVSFMAEQCPRLNTRFDELRAHVDDRVDRLADRVAQVERRPTASTHLEQGPVAHMASLYESMDNFRATSVAFDQRPAALEAR